MNKYQWEGKWHQLKGEIRREWNDLTEDELKAAEGRAEYLLGRIEERYGISKQLAAQRIEELSARCRPATY